MNTRDDGNFKYTHLGLPEQVHQHQSRFVLPAKEAADGSMKAGSVTCAKDARSARVWWEGDIDRDLHQLSKDPGLAYVAQFGSAQRF